jgi:hypothetical protein
MGEKENYDTSGEYPPDDYITSGTKGNGNMIGLTWRVNPHSIEF